MSAHEAIVIGRPEFRSPITIARGLLSSWSEVIEFQAATIVCREPGDPHYEVFASYGYRPAVLRYLAQDFSREPGVFDTVREAYGAPLYWDDVRGFRATSSAKSVLLPSGYREGSSIALDIEGGVVTSLLHVSFTRSQIDSGARAGLIDFAEQSRILIADHRELRGFKLSPREFEVLKWVVQGLSNSEIGSRLGIKPRTVATHLERIFEKTGISSRLLLAVRATELGLL